jgi:hypothetical protein
MGIRAETARFAISSTTADAGYDPNRYASFNQNAALLDVSFDISRNLGRIE